MKQILYSICIGSLALSLTAWGEQNKDKDNGRGNGKARGTSNVRATTSANAGATVRPQRYMSSAPLRQRTYSATPQTNSGSVVNRSNFRNARVQDFRERNLSSNNDIRARNNVAFNRERNFNANGQSNVIVNRERNFNVNRERNFNLNRESNVAVNRERNFNVNRERNETVRNNWRGENFNGERFATFRDHRHEWHDRDWWRSHCSRIIFVSGGWYAWDAGYWYPAWGYDPGCYYPYDGPIYGGYSYASPDQVIINVQVQLEREGYYVGGIDGVLGPMTRRAIAAFQTDHGLAITWAIDEPTLATLGLS